jgi:peptide/nickel transport system substrate-binding protein
MLSKRYQVAALAVCVATVLAACGTPAAAPTATTEIVNPPVIKEATATSAAAAPTAAPTDTAAPTAAPAATDTAAATTVAEAPFVLNGVTLPFKRSETVVMDQVNYSVFDSFNLFIPNGNEFAAGHQQISLEYLWYVNYATGDIIPWLADSFEYSKDYKTLTIRTHKGAAWNDGQPFTAKDIVFTFEMRKKDPGALGDPDPDKVVSQVSASDDQTVVYQFTSPQPRYHLQFWCTICTGSTVVPEHIWSKVDPKTFKNNPPVTTGPYMFDKAYPQQKIYVWKKNPNYWNKAKYDPKPNYVVYRSGAQTADQGLAEAKANNTDIFGLDNALYADQKGTIPQITQVAYVDPCPRAIWFNRAKAPFDKPEFVRALSMLMNREKWGTNIWIPASKPAVGLWADYRNLDKYINADSNTKWKTLNYAPDEAMKLLESIGYKKDGDTLKDASGKAVAFNIGTPTGPNDNEYKIAQDWIQDLKAAGINATLSNYEQAVWFPKVNNGDWDAGVWWFCGATVDPMELYNGYTCDRVAPIGQRNVKGNDPRYCNKDFDQVVSKLRNVTPDAPEAKALYQQAFDEWLKDPPGVPLIQTYYTAYYNNTYWDNMLSNSNLYTVPFNWWGQIMFVLFNIKTKA